MKNACLFACALLVSAWAGAQTPWPAVQAENYPLVSEMQLVRHEQSVLLGESDMQTGLFYAYLSGAPVEKTQSQLITDALRKGWSLQSAMRFGANSMLAFAKGSRLLDIRLALQGEGVEAMYSVALHQQPQAPAQPQTSLSPQPAVYGRSGMEQTIPSRLGLPGRYSSSEYKVPAGHPGAR